MLLVVQDLCVSVDTKVILHDVSLEIPRGGVHVLMGPNGSGKSTLCHALIGHPGYVTTNGVMQFNGLNLRTLKPHERAQAGLFVGFQHSPEIPGVSLLQLMRAAEIAHHTEGQLKTSVKELAERIILELRALNLPEEFLHRPLGDGASGGEKKRLEMVQLAILRPSLAILDEIDSGVDADAVQLIVESILRAKEKYGTTFLLITHHNRLVEQLSPDLVHIMMGGKIVKHGDKSLLKHVTQKGYGVFTL